MTTTDAVVEATEERRKPRQDLTRPYRKSKPGSAVEATVVEEYLPLVRTVVGRVAMGLPSHVDIEELNSAGLVGLLNAVRQFDPLGGSTFESYARVRIRGAIFDELRRQDWVPRSVHEKARRVQNAMQRIEQVQGRLPTDAEVARELDLSPADYAELLEEIKPVTFVCLDAAPSAADDDDSTRYESIADGSQPDPVEQTSRRELAGVVAERLEQLPEVQRKVLALYYFEDMRLREIAEAFGVTESRICQIHSQAILAIRNFLKKHEAMPSS